jgi:signal transduction histidine kinase
VTPRVGNLRLLRRRLPRPTARLRLTGYFGGLFLVSALALLTVTYLLFRQTGGQGEPQAVLQHTTDVHKLLITCLIAFTVVGVLAIASGWLVAGRVLRPLRTMNDTARNISANNLHERLTLNGPDDEFTELGGTLNDLLGRLDASFQSQERFVANASHELQTPLTLERSLLEAALVNRGTTAESWRSTGQRLLAANEQQSRLIDALLTLARSQRGLARLARIDLAEIAEDVIDARDHHMARLRLSVQATLNPAPMHGDPDLLESLVSNLVDNAIRHNSADGRIEITTSMRSGAAVVSVGNTGPVIPTTETTRLLQPFEQLSKGRVRTGDGHGIGLAIVQAIVTTHSATLNLQPRPAGGLDVEVLFPASIIDTAHSPVARHQPPQIVNDTLDNPLRLRQATAEQTDETASR